MKRMMVNNYQVALVFKRGVYSRLLIPGTYWLGWNETAKLYDLTQPFVPPCELNILLQDEDLRNALHVMEVKDNEIVLLYENGLFKQVLTAGRYTYWKSVVKYDFVRADTSVVDIPPSIDRSLLGNRQVAAYVRSYTVESYEKALLVIDGKYAGILNGGVYYWWKNNTMIQVNKTDMRQLQIEINGQEILTKDKSPLRINAHAQYVVKDIEKALLQNKEYDRHLYVAFQLALREFVGTLTLDELLEKKETIAPFILKEVYAKASLLGVEVNGFGIRDIILPGEIKDILNQVLIAEKKAQANIIMRREETASTRSLLNTARLMEENPVLLKLKEMEYVEKIADKISSISVGSNGVLIDQLKQILIPERK